jgi:hypothetical protein
MPNKLKFNINKESFQDLIEKLSDLTTIDDTIKLKIDNDNILMYSTLGGNVMLAFKNYLINTKEYFEFKNELESTYDLVIANASKFVKNLDFIKNESKITMEIFYKESKNDENIMSARSIQVIGGKLKVNWLAGEKYEIKDINKNVLRQRLDIKNRKWSFTLNNTQFNNIKKLSNINSEKVINIDVTDGRILFSENAAWEMEIGEIETKSASFIFNKRFLKCIDSSREEIEFSLFDTFILVKDKNSNLMLSYEQNFSDDDI